MECSPFFADRYGRRCPIVIGCVIETVGALLGAFANSYEMYMAGRFILGFGSSFNGGMAGLLITEMYVLPPPPHPLPFRCQRQFTDQVSSSHSAHPQHRAKISAIVNCMYGVGSTSCAWLALATIKIAGDWSWRSLNILQCVPGVLILCCIYWVPESPRWLVANERYEDAEAMLARYHGNGDRTNETVMFEFEEMKKTLALEFANKKLSSFLDFGRTAGNRYRVMLLISLAMVSQYSGSNLFGNYANKIYEGAGITEQTNKILVCIRPVQPFESPR